MSSSEDLHADVRRLLKHLGLEFSDETIAAALDRPIDQLPKDPEPSK